MNGPQDPLRDRGKLFERRFGLFLVAQCRTGRRKKGSTVWVLEGITSYLSQDELDALLAGITKLSASLSSVVATWIRPAKNADTEQPIVMKSGLHRTFFEDPSATLARAGAWRLQSQHSIEEWGARLGVAVPTSPVGGGYWLTLHII